MRHHHPSGVNGVDVTTGWFLVVEDHAWIARTIEARLQRVGRVVVHHSVSPALKSLEEEVGAPLGATIDLGLPDGSGLRVLTALRKRWPRVPVLIVTAACEPNIVNSVQELGAEFVCKPDFMGGLDAFIKRLPGDCAQQAALRELALQCCLTPRETEIATLYLRFRRNKDIATALGVSSNTLKTQVRSLLRKTGRATLADLTHCLEGSPVQAA